MEIAPAKWRLRRPRREVRDLPPWRRALSSAAETCRGSPRSYGLGQAASMSRAATDGISPGPYSFAPAKQHEFRGFSHDRAPIATGAGPLRGSRLILELFQGPERSRSTLGFYALGVLPLEARTDLARVRIERGRKGFEDHTADVDRPVLDRLH